MRTDQGSVFASDHWKQLININDVETGIFKAQTYSSLEIKELLHNPRRRMFRKMRHDNLDDSQALAL